MNKQEFQQKIKDMRPPKFFTAISLGEAFEAGFEQARVNALLASDLLDEPEKPLVPRFVADYIDSERNSGSTLSEALGNMYYKQRIADWFYINSETFAKAWLYGYEVEHEQQYVVAIPDDGRNGFIQLWKNREGKLLFNFEDKIKYGKVHLLTEQEIKQKDERLWKFAEEAEE